MRMPRGRSIIAHSQEQKRTFGQCLDAVVQTHPGWEPLTKKYPPPACFRSGGGFWGDINVPLRNIYVEENSEEGRGELNM